MFGSIRLLRILLLLYLLGYAKLQADNWLKIAEGLEYGKFQLAMASTSGDSSVDIIRIDPAQYDFELLLASEHANNKRTIKDWAIDFHLTGAINAGMYQTDHITSTGYLINYQHKNNPSRHSTYNMYFVCNPREEGLPEAQMIDRQQPGAEDLVDRYYSSLQCIRMAATGGRNVWSEQADKWSEAALGQDIDGNILFIFCSSPYTMHDLVNLLLQLPLHLDKMMHLEGGPEASCYIETEKFQLRRAGSYETVIFDNTEQVTFWQVPNIIGFRKR